MLIKIDDIGDERVSVYTRYNEPQLVHYNEPGPGIFIAETPMVIERAMDRGAKILSFFIEDGAAERPEVAGLLERAGSADVFSAPLQVINRITGFNLTRGVLAAFLRPALPDAAGLIGSSRYIAVLEDIVNPTNVGAIFRSAAALGIDSVLITHGSSDPFYRRATRVSMGTVFQLPWTYVPAGCDPISLLHEGGFSVIAMELADNAVPVTDPVLRSSEKRALVFGAEGAGISQKTLDGCDHIAVIPMQGGVDSLNVAASSAVAFWELCGR
ncbi:MAG: RNA methyltransferase [Lachnospiraceae bacterium]|nr:RNA methyltransferase [Lachnospiraceae bacterium]